SQCKGGGCLAHQLPNYQREAAHAAGSGPVGGTSMGTASLRTGHEGALPLLATRGSPYRRRFYTQVPPLWAAACSPLASVASCREIVYPCISNPYGKDEGGLASSSLVREGGE
ncbi:hypothetical protein B296_00024284, partial [Ensete ventricosum]